MMAGYLNNSSLLLHRMQTHQHAGPSCRISTTVIHRGLSATQGLPVVQRRVVSARASDEGPLGSGKLGQAVEDSYEEEIFDEGAAQVQRLLSRDRKELTGIEDIGQGLQAEFDEKMPAREQKQPEKNGAKPASGTPGAFSAGKKPAAPFGKVSGSSSPFGAPGKAKASSAAKPFSGAGNQNLFKEMDNLSPYMQPDQMDEKPWWQNISLGQVLIVLSFTLIISLMIGTFTVVYKAGGIHFNE